MKTDYKKDRIGGARFGVLVLGLFLVLNSAMPAFADGQTLAGQALAAKHANMKRFYEEAHKPAPTLVEIKAAAEKGDAASQFALAELYNSQLDYATALIWYRKAAEQGHTNAQYLVGDFLLNGRSGSSTSAHAIPADSSEAVIWLGKAANNGHVQSQVALANCYRDGVGVNLDLVESFKWYSLAARQTNAFAAKSVQDLTLKLRSEQIAVAQAGVNSFVPGQETDLFVPAYMDKLKLNGISGTRHKPLAIVNNHTLSVDESVEIKLDSRMMEVRCLAIGNQTVTVQVGPFRKELQYRD